MEQLVNFIIRPPRAEYDPKHDLLDQEFMLKGKWYQRKDLEVKNSRGDVLQCSHYKPIITPGEKPLPCVIYCHGNSGCRADCSEAAIILLPSNITVFTLDFSGSGLSGGEHVTLGWNEKDDLKVVVDYLRADGNVSLIGLWGRSMGAVTSLMYGAEDPSIAGMVLDSPFSDLVELMMELVDTYKVRLPKFTVKFAIQFMRRAIQKKAKFDITDLNPVKVAKSCFVPVLLGHAIEDDFIRPHHSDQILEAYMGDKNIIKFEGDHNSPRPQFYFDSINIFFHNVLQPPEAEVGDSFFETLDDYMGKGSWSTIYDVGFDQGSSAARRETSASSTVDAIEQVRSRRPMSRMEVPADIPSKDDQSGNEDEGADNEHGSSSSRMINFELSNGDPYGPHVPTTMNDEQYLEYQLDDLTGFPCSAEEEKRMLMEAVLASLKDMEIQGPKEVAGIGASTKSPKSSRVYNSDAYSSSTLGNHVPLRTETVSTSPSTSEFSTCGTDSGNLAPEHSPSDTCLSTAKPIHDAPSAVCLNNATSSSTDADDLSGKTKATVTVERNPATHIMDGLMRRWDLNFFRR